MMLPKMICCRQGVRFVAGVAADRLLEHVRAADTNVEENGDEDSWQNSLLQLFVKMTRLSPKELFQLHGFFVLLKPNQVLEVPGGYILAETSMTNVCVTSSWNCLRAEDANAAWVTGLVGSLQDLAQADLATESLLGAQSQNLTFLKQASTMMQGSPALFEWLQLQPSNDMLPSPSRPETQPEKAFLSLGPVPDDWGTSPSPSSRKEPAMLGCDSEIGEAARITEEQLKEAVPLLMSHLARYSPKKNAMFPWKDLCSAVGMSPDAELQLCLG